MRIILLEDDQYQSEVIATAIQKSFPDAVVSRVGTEQEFRSKLDEIVAAKPTVAILDVMVTWQRPDPTIHERPLEVRAEGHFRAGLRCRRLLWERDRAIPVILYSVLERRDLDAEADELEGVCYMQKQGDVAPLVQQVRQVKRERQPPPSSSASPPPTSS